MSKSRRRRRRHGGGRFIMLEHGVMNSPAYQSLTGPALKLLLEVWKRHDGQNNGMISFSTREAAKLLGSNKNTAARRFAELEEKGFLVAEIKGAFSVKHRQATVWRLTMVRTMAGDRVVPATREYQRWRPSASTNGGATPLAGTRKRLDGVSRIRSGSAFDEIAAENQNTVSFEDSDGTA